MSAEANGFNSEGDLLKQQAKEYVDEGLRGSAVVTLMKLDQLEPQTGFYAVLLAENLRLIGRFSEALDVLKRATDPDRRWSVAYVRSKIFTDLGETALAEEHLREAMLARPDHTGGYVLLANMLMHRERLDEARSLLERAQQVAGHQDEVWVNLGDIHRAKGEYAQALQCYRSALEIDPQYEGAILGTRDMETILAIG